MWTEPSEPHEPIGQTEPIVRTIETVTCPECWGNAYTVIRTQEHRVTGTFDREGWVEQSDQLFPWDALFTCSGCGRTYRRDLNAVRLGEQLSAEIGWIGETRIGPDYGPQVHRVFDTLGPDMSIEAKRLWMRTPNEHLDDGLPIEWVKRGDNDAVHGSASHTRLESDRRINEEFERRNSPPD